MSATPLDCKVFSSWRDLAKSGKPGVHAPKVMHLPAALEVVLAVNDGGHGHAHLGSVQQVAKTNSAQLSLALRNHSLVDWDIGFVGESSTKQIFFNTGAGDLNEFSVVGKCTGVIYGNSELSHCRQIAVSISKSSDHQKPEHLSGRIEFGNKRVTHMTCDYGILLE